MTTVVEEPRLVPPGLDEEVPHFACIACEAEKVTHDKIAKAKRTEDLLGMFVNTVCGIEVLTIDWLRWCEDAPDHVCQTCMELMQLHENLCLRHSHLEGLIP